ncbi:MAG TPA: NlpC/P60 family protein [Jatrophihabitans sp.]|nr:NlpC/P60 family protein [Jatrophihabitans sp.]
MHWKSSSRPFGRRGTAAVVLGVAAAVLLASPGLAVAKPQPPTAPTAPNAPSETVSQAQVDRAQGAKRALADQIGVLSGEIAQAQIEVQQAQAKAEQAEQKYADAIDKLRKARQAAVAAQTALQNAKVDVTNAHARYIEFIRASYMSGDIGGTAGTLLTAKDPSSLLEQSALEQYQQQHKADAVGALEAATIARSNAEAAARRAVDAREHAKVVAAQRKQEAQAAFVAAQQQQAQLEDQMASKRQEMQQKQMQLLQLKVGRARTVRYQQQLQAYNQRLNSYHQQLHNYHVSLARWQEAQRRKHQHASHSGGSTFSPGPSAPSGGSWTAAKGRRAAHRALSQLGTPYAWAGGGAFGPSYGVCAGGDAWNDCNVRGYDCSGLAMYAWGGSWWAHYAASQYTQVGSYHPGAGNLRPGDLVFWSYNGSISGIHHVAIYIGGGRIVEAPYSGGYVQTASVWEYGGFFGATRPLT